MNIKGVTRINFGKGGENKLQGVLAVAVVLVVSAGKPFLKIGREYNSKNCTKCT